MKLTIFTPTYNRAYILGQLYQSLLRQTCHDFEWLIVDDGSADDTEALVHSWMEAKNPFPIRYHKQENGGSGPCFHAFPSPLPVNFEIS